MFPRATHASSSHGHSQDGDPTSTDAAGNATRSGSAFNTANVHHSQSPSGEHVNNPYQHQPHFIPTYTPVPLRLYKPANTSKTSEARPVPDAHYGRPHASPAVGSLGTPHIGSMMWQPVSVRGMSGPTGSHSPSNGHSFPGRNHSGSSLSTSHSCSQQRLDEMQQGEGVAIVLLPTRPLLKALAKQCKPLPPWSVGGASGLSLAEEIMQFSQFVAATTQEVQIHEALIKAMSDRFNETWLPGGELQPMGATAAGQPTSKSIMTHYYATCADTVTDPAEWEQQTSRLWQVCSHNDLPVSVEFGKDYRGILCAIVTDTRSGERCCIRYGPDAHNAAPAAAELKERVASNPVGCAVYRVLLALLTQNKLLDDVGTQGELINAEAVAVMLLAVMNSYAPGDTPDAGRLLLDFFLTFGFEAYFDATKSSVNVRGMFPATAKVHGEAKLSVLDVSDSMDNLTPRLDRVSSLQAVFNYCYVALSQYAQVSSNQRRAQSALSTIIGGEPFWSRVLKLYEEHVEPFHSAVNAKKEILARSL